MKIYFLHPEGPAARLSACHVSIDEWLSLRLALLGEPFFKEETAESSVLSILVAFFFRGRKFPEKRTASSRKESEESKTMSGDGATRLTLDSTSQIQTVKLQSHSSSYIKKLANEPSIGLFEVQEHVHRAVPRQADTVRKLDKCRQGLSDAAYDVDYSIITVKSWQEMVAFQRIKRMMSASIMSLEMMSEGKPPNFSVIDDVATKPSPSQGRKRTPTGPRHRPPSRPSSALSPQLARVDHLPTEPVVGED